ncbi:MAG TPA: bis-aminopropyl spermidine synthase family protein [Acidimicrobiia bacterium]|nr:bis-aminopropyl spermidine synthase family protein [Acidimicrobiia bacterium]
MTDPAAIVAALRAEWSLDFRRVRRVLAASAAGASLGEAVAASGLARRDVEAVLAAVSAPIPPELSAEPVLPDGPALAARMAGLAERLPPARWRLDHVPATAETMARRALYLGAEYELAGASVLCLGDHDLTALAVGAVAPGAALSVVDIDERILDHIAGSAPGAGLAVTAAWADLRLALPPSLTGTADLVFTDPPYTVDGMRLFLVRALEALRPSGHGRIAFCFGTGERHLVKALEVQALLGDLRLVLEAMLPGFNRYAGAEAIGARSDLYVCRPTTGARVGEAAVPSARRGSGPRGRRSPPRPAALIYTRGPASEEAQPAPLPDAVKAAALTPVADGTAVLVGAGWPGTAVALPEFFGRLAAWTTAARPGPCPFSGPPVINTAPDFAGAALRALLLAAPEAAVLVLPRREVADLDLPLLRAAYDLNEVPTGPGGDPAVLAALRKAPPPADDAEAVLRHLVLHPGAKVGNAWRDALLAAARTAGAPLTKNDARARIAAAIGDDHRILGLRTWELPLSALRRLSAAVRRPAAMEGTGVADPQQR